MNLNLKVKQGKRPAARHKVSAIRNINKPHEFGDFCFDYLKACKHNHTTRQQCPLCTLAHQYAKKFFLKEEEQRSLAHEESVHNRSILRTSLLRLWACCQASHYHAINLAAAAAASTSATSGNLLSMLGSSASGGLNMKAISDQLASEQAALDIHTLDIGFCYSLIECLLQFSEVITLKKSKNDVLAIPSIPFEPMIKILQRRNRIYEVGHFAAVFIQSHVRRYIVQRRMRKYLLLRFEYVNATLRKAEFFFDREKQRQLGKYPKFLINRNERPATPRTISRRLDFEENRRKNNYVNYLRSVQKLKEEGLQFEIDIEGLISHFKYDKRAAIMHTNRFPSPSHRGMDYALKRESSLKIEYLGEAIMERERCIIHQLKQLSIVRDLIYITMYRLTMAAANKPNKDVSFSATGGSTPGTGESSKKKGGETLVPAVIAATNPSVLSPVWMMPTAPTMSARSLGLGIALMTNPSPASAGFTGNAAPLLRNNSIGSGGPGSVGSLVRTNSIGSAGSGKLQRSDSVSSVGSNSSAKDKDPKALLKAATSNNVKSANTSTGINIYRALFLLEQYGVDALRCRSPEEVMDKLLLADLLPVYESVFNITQDECGIWDAVFKKKRATTTTASKETAPSTNQGYISSNSSVSSANTIAYNNKTMTGSSPFGILPYDEDDASQFTLQDMVNLEGDNGQQYHEVLPFGIHLRAAPKEQRTANGLFRLFFYNEEFIAVSSYSPWVFYPEVMKSKDSILASLKKFVNAAPTKLFIKEYYKAVNARCPNSVYNAANIAVNSNTVNNAPAKKAAPPKLTKGNSTVGKNPPPSNAPTTNVPQASPVFTPSEHMIFANDRDSEYRLAKPQDFMTLNDASSLVLSEKYSFIKKLAMFQDRLKRASAAASRRGNRKTDTDSVTNNGKTITAGSPTEQEKLKSLFESCAGGLMGRQIYGLFEETQRPGTQPSTATNTTTKTAAIAVESPLLDPYTQALLDYSCDVDIEIDNRVVRSPELVESHPPAPAQLLVLDVYVNMPKPKQAPTRRGASGDDSGASKDISVELHQVVGIFPCEIEKCPANLDTGLLDYDFFHNIYLQQTAAPSTAPTPGGPGSLTRGNSMMGAGLTRSNSVMSNASTGSGSRDTGVVVWSQCNPSSGLCVGKSILPSGKEFQFHLLGNTPSKDYLTNNLPKKVKEWLGMATNTNTFI